VARAFVALGSNEGDRAANLETAIERICRIPRTCVSARSTLHDTAPVGGPPQGRYLNGAVEVTTQLEPEALMRELLAIERDLGRVRREKHGPRTIDLDLLLYDERTVATHELELPHPRLHERGFVLAPLAELAPEVVVPGKGTIRDLYEVWRRSSGAEAGAAERGS
jgi:2-amino-4-hydroxy-6-hydroxymethyldihydropteridine diphosphokinase